jgi:large subunit ribosomal protein L25
MSDFVLNAELRQDIGKRARRIRREGKIPGVYYAHGEENLNIQVSSLSLAPLVFTSKTRIIDLRTGDGASRKCILRNVQFDPVTDKPVHFDLQGLKENEKLMLEVPVVLVGGIPKGVRDGGLLQHIMHRIKISCLPKDIPEKVEINVSGLEMNRAIHISDLRLANVTVLDTPESAIVAVMPPPAVQEVEVAPAAAEAPAEPEVLAKGKKAEEGEESVEEGKEPK